MDSLPSGDPVRRRLSPTAVVLVCAAAALGVVELILLVVAVTLGSAGAQVLWAQSSISSAKESLLDGDYDDAAGAAAAGQRQVEGAARTLAWSPALPLLSSLPGGEQTTDDLAAMVDAGEVLADASVDVVGVYGAATGRDGAPGIFSGGVVDFEAVAAVSESVDDVIDLTAEARAELETVDGVGIGGGTLVRARDRALAELGPLSEQLGSLSELLDRVPDAAGEGGQKSYLLVTQNPAELFAGGGASLSVAVVRFTDGQMSIPVKGAVSTKLFPNNPRVVWDHVAPLAYFVPRQPAAFAWSNLDPDFPTTAEEMRRAWVANGQEPVDGVISVDPTALAAALRVTGPIDAPGYGTITADNLVQVLLVDAYAKFDADQTERHQLNESLMDAVFARLSGGDGALRLLSALASTAPGRHFRVNVVDPKLQAMVEEAGLAGDMPVPAGEDSVAWFSQNQNGSKVDIFQQRSIAQDVTIAADGSAEVTSRLTVRYDVPDSGRDASARIGYLTDWSFNWYLGYVPSDAMLLEFGAPRADPEDKDDPAFYSDPDGWQIRRVGRWTPAGGSTTVTMRYSFPAGTFTGSDKPYRVVMVPQPMLTTAQVSMTVKAPAAVTLSGDEAPGWSASGDTATWSGPLTELSSSVVRW